MSAAYFAPQDRGKKNWGESGRVLQLLDNARSKGLEGDLDQYPLHCGSTMLDALIPPVFHADGQKKMLEYIGDPSVRQKIREMTDGTDGTQWENWVGTCGWDGILINSVGSEKTAGWKGKNRAEIAAGILRDLWMPSAIFSLRNRALRR